MYQAKPRPLLRGAVAVLAVIQVFVMAICAFKSGPKQIVGENSLGTVLTYGGFITGAANHFGFFAPGVISQFRTRYKVYEDKNLLSEGRLNQGNLETTFRYHNMVENYFMQNMEEVSTPQRSLMSSWAARLFAGDPRSNRVEMIIEAYVLPTMESYRNGERPHWIEYRQAEYVRSAAPQS